MATGLSRQRRRGSWSGFVTSWTFTKSAAKTIERAANAKRREASQYEMASTSAPMVRPEQDMRVYGDRRGVPPKRFGYGHRAGQMVVVANYQHMVHTIVVESLLAVQQVFVCTGGLVLHENVLCRDAVGDQIVPADLCFCFRFPSPSPPVTSKADT